ncbi:oxidoreductase [Gracilaria domingensis]|nr:oxidoreductase [Gracilaria domingensis]
MVLSPDFAKKYGPWALVTGASAGIGAEFATQLAACGLNVVLVARREAVLNENAAALREKYPVQTRCITADLTSEEGCEEVVKACEDLEIGLLVNNAGMSEYGSFFRSSAGKHSKMISLNCVALVSLSHAFGRMMIERKRGGILFISSCLSSPMPYFATYSASKSFVTSFGRMLREELKKYHVDATVIEPGVVESELSRAAKQDMDFDKGGFTTMPAEQCVAESLSALANGKSVHIPGFQNKVAMAVMRSIPADVSMKMSNVLVDRMMSPEIMKPM